MTTIREGSGGLDIRTRMQKFSVEHHMPVLYVLFMKVAEPRVIRLMHFVIYICMTVAGLGTIFGPPQEWQNILGHVLIYVFGGFVFTGAFICSVSILPGIWWLERVGIIMLTTSMAMYTVVIVGAGRPPVSVAVTLALTLSFAQRWLEIKGAQLAPRDPTAHRGG